MTSRSSLRFPPKPASRVGASRRSSEGTDEAARGLFWPTNRPSMAARSSSGRSGFETYASIPASRHRSRSPVIACAVMATIGNMSAGRSLSFPNRGGRLEATHLRHLHVHENDVEGLFSRLVERLRGRSRDDDGVAVLFEERHDQLLIRHIVFGHQDAEGTRPRPGRWRLPPPASRSTFGRDRCAEHRDDRVEQVGLLDRLAQARREADFARTRSTERQARRGQHDEPGAREPRVGSDRRVPTRSRRPRA